MSDSDQHALLDEEKKEKEAEEEVVFPPLSDKSIRKAVRLWKENQAQATESMTTLTSGTPAKSLT